MSVLIVLLKVVAWWVVLSFILGGLWSAFGWLSNRGGWR